MPGGLDLAYLLTGDVWVYGDKGNGDKFINKLNMGGNAIGKIVKQMKRGRDYGQDNETILKNELKSVKPTNIKDKKNNRMKPKGVKLV